MLIPKEVRAKWIAALRSGEYKQTRHKLHRIDENKFCCLGVLCDLAVKEGVIFGPLNRGGIALYADESLRTENTLLETVRKWAGLCSLEGDFISVASIKEVQTLGLYNLAHINDHTVLTFNDIADFIESEPKGLICDSASSPTESTVSGGA